MKKAFTLIELMVTITIIGVLFSMSIPLYDKQILKSKFDNEAVLTLKSFILAQEQYHIETGKYYTLTSGTINNENVISSNLKIDLSKTNNFLYQLVSTEDEQSYKVKAILRSDEWDDDCTLDNKDQFCKQVGVVSIDDWATSYTRNENNHYLEMSYPTVIDGSINGISYTNMLQGD